MPGEHAEQGDAGDRAQQQGGQGGAQGLAAIGAQVGQVGAEESGQAEHEQVGGDGQEDVAEYRETQANADPAAIGVTGAIYSQAINASTGIGLASRPSRALSLASAYI